MARLIKMAPIVLAIILAAIFIATATEPPSTWKKIYTPGGLFIWDPDSGTVYMVQGYLGEGISVIERGVYRTTQRDTVELDSTDTDTLDFPVPYHKGYFTLWAVLDSVAGATDSFSISYNPIKDGSCASNTATAIISNLDWVDGQYWFWVVEPPLADTLRLFISHTNAAGGDSSTIILILDSQ